MSVKPMPGGFHAITPGIMVNGRVQQQMKQRSSLTPCGHVS